MTDRPAIYDVQDRTGNPEHASVDAVCECPLDRAADPRTEDPDGNLDTAMATAVERYGESTVRTVVRRILVDQVTFRTAAGDAEIETIDAVRIGTTATHVLGELNTSQRA